MITIYRRAEVIAQCERAAVLAGLKSGRFELTDHYDSAETSGWISLTHFVSRCYEIAVPTTAEEAVAITIYRRAEVIARCKRAEVLAGLKSGRFELTDHYDSAETSGWISLTHFVSRCYENAEPTTAEVAGAAEPINPIITLLALPFMPFVALFRLAGWVAECLSKALDFTVVLSLALVAGLVIAAVTGLLIYYAPAAAAILFTLYLYNRKR